MKTRQAVLATLLVLGILCVLSTRNAQGDTAAAFTVLVDDAAVELPADAVVMTAATATAMAAPVPPPIAPDVTFGWVFDFGKQILAAFNAGEYTWAAGAILLLLLALLRRFWNFVPDDYKPYFVGAAGIVGATSTGLMSGATVWHALRMGFFTAAAAAFFWSLLTPLRRKFPKLDKFLKSPWPFKSKA